MIGGRISDKPLALRPPQAGNVRETMRLVSKEYSSAEIETGIGSGYRSTANGLHAAHFHHARRQARPTKRWLSSTMLNSPDGTKKPSVARTSRRESVNTCFLTQTRRWPSVQ